MDTKETKAQKVERLKRSLNPWQCLEEVRRFAREGYGAIPPEWLGTYFRWWGVHPDEVCGASPLVEQATGLRAGDREVYNLPRKFKICITGCRLWCTYPEI